MDLTDHTYPRDSEMSNEMLSRVTHVFDSPNNPYGLINHQRTDAIGDACIRQHKQPLRTQ